MIEERPRPSGGQLRADRKQIRRAHLRAQSGESFTRRLGLMGHRECVVHLLVNPRCVLQVSGATLSLSQQQVKAGPMPRFRFAVEGANGTLGFARQKRGVRQQFESLKSQNTFRMPRAETLQMLGRSRTWWA